MKDSASPEDTHPIHLHVPGVLKLLSEHLYSDPRIALRELIQNAHDSCLRRMAEDPNLPSDYHPTIDIRINLDNRTLSIIDNGSGLTPEEIHQYLATIGRGYTSELRQRLEFGSHNEAQNLIGQFGLGLLSAFLVAERLVIDTRSYQQGAGAYTWESTGNAEYKLWEAPDQNIGTSYTLYLKVDGEYLLNERLVGETVRLYANYLQIPITLNGNPMPVNAMTAPWYNDSSRDDYLQFVNEHTEWHAPLSILPLVNLVDEVQVTDRSQDVVLTPLRGVLVIPPSTTVSLREYGMVTVYIRRMFITDSELDLLPHWARFVTGIIDSPALTPTASRESIRHDEAFYSIQRALEDQLLDHFQILAREYPKNWQQIIEAHSDLFKGWALESPNLFDIVADQIAFATNEGDLPLAEIAERSGGTISYLTDKRDVNLLMLLNTVQGSLVVDASGFADEAFLQLYAARRVTVRICPFETAIEVLMPTADDPSRYQPMIDYYSNQGVVVRIVSLDSSEIPAFLIDPSKETDVVSDEMGEVSLEESVSFLVREFRRLHPVDNNVTEMLFLNATSPLIARLAEAESDSLWWSAMLEILYRIAQINSGKLRSPDKMREAYALLTFSLNQLIRPQTDQHAD